jgi:hypothetical protein
MSGGSKTTRLGRAHNRRFASSTACLTSASIRSREIAAADSENQGIGLSPPRATVQTAKKTQYNALQNRGILGTLLA